jgi:hypothetical protein
MPEGVEIPIKHDIPKTTLDSLVQIKNEFNSRLAEAVEKNDSSKKRRYQRQLKVNSLFLFYHLFKKKKLYSNNFQMIKSNSKMLSKPPKKENHLIMKN